MPMAWPQFEVSPRFAFCMVYLFIVSFFKWDACFCQQPAWALLDFSAFPFCPFCLLYLLLILFGGCRSTRRSSAKSPPGRRRTSGAPWPTATSRWSTRGASVTIYLYVTKTTTTDRRLSEPDLHNNCFGFFYIPFSLQIRHFLSNFEWTAHPVYVQEYNVKPSKTAVNGGSKPATSLHNSGYTSQPER